MNTGSDNSSVPVNEDFNNDFQFIFRNCDQNKISPFMKLFWEEQIKYLNSSSQIRYHPMVIKYCLGLHAKSPACYEQVRLNVKECSGILVLPSQTTLRDYKNYIRPECGFNPKVIEELALKTKDFSSVEKFICICFDEMKIQDDLVWDKHTGELIGFVDLGDVNLNYASLNDVHEIASHVCNFLIKSIANPLSFSFATFATTGVTSDQLYHFVWRAVAILERTCFLKVVATSCDGGSLNRAFYRIHTPYSLQTSDI